MRPLIVSGALIFGSVLGIDVVNPGLGAPVMRKSALKRHEAEILDGANGPPAGEDIVFGKDDNAGRQDYVYTYEEESMSQKYSHPSEHHKRKNPAKPSRRHPPAAQPSKPVSQAEYKLYHYPYRVKFPAFPKFGMCNLKDFTFNEETDRLGKGGFGQVFEAKHVSGAIVALKKIEASSIKNNPKHVENEETIHKMLVHPYIARLYCSMTSQKWDVYFVLDYFKQGNLSKQLSTMYPFSRHTFVKYVAQITLALQHIHSHCLVYRDIKAENIMVDAEDNIRLIDFGLAVYDCNNELKNLAGTLEYLAPEVAGRKRYGRSADWFSLGVLVYVIAKNKLPYRRPRDGKKDEFARLIASGKVTIPPTGDEVVDELITYLADPNQHRRWKNMTEKFGDFKRLAFFRGFEWGFYEDQVAFNTLP